MATWLAMRLWPAIACLAAVVVAAAGCGGSSKTTTSTAPSPETWANDLCSSFNSYVSSLKTVGSTITGGNVTKYSLQKAVNDAASATQTLVTDVKQLGPPATAAGAQAKKTVDSLASQLQKDADSAKSAVADVSGTTGLLNAISVVTGVAATAKSQVTSTFNQLKQLSGGDELQKAFQSADACKNLVPS
jgi:hypothetical protein